MSLDADAYVYCESCGSQFDPSDFDLSFFADHGDSVDGECPDCGRCDCLRIQG